MKIIIERDLNEVEKEELKEIIDEYDSATDADFEIGFF